jgi:hypothetical protein
MPGQTDGIALAMREDLLPGSVDIEPHGRGPARVGFDAEVASRSGGDVKHAIGADNGSPGDVLPACRQIGDLDRLRRDGKIVGDCAVHAIDSVVRPDIQSAALKCQAVRAGQSREYLIHPIRGGNRVHRACTPRGDVKYAVRTKGHQAGSAGNLGINGDLEPGWRLQFRKLELTLIHRGLRE